ncbi:MAG TPA: hypothetical protein VFE21_08900 [Rubrobacteraceae bacterium]|nr:hypothetical protein [Rubrobacteraceae bacterium]
MASSSILDSLESFAAALTETYSSMLLGRALIQLHTYGERFAPEGARGGVPQGRARYEKPIPETPEGYPEDYAYDEATETLRVGAGEFRR